MSNWQGEFDFDQIETKPQPKKDKLNKKSNKPNDDDFFDLDQDHSKDKNQKLPAITKLNKEPVGNKSMDNNKAKPAKNTYDDYDEIYEEVQEVKTNPISKKKEPTIQKAHQYQEELEDLNEIVSLKKKDQPKKIDTLPKIKDQEEKPKKIKGGKLQENDQESFYESLQDVYSPPKPPKKQTTSDKVIAKSVEPPVKKIEKDQIDEYEDEKNFDDYQEDFQIADEKTKKQPQRKSTTKEEVGKKSSTVQNLKVKNELKVNVLHENKNKEVKPIISNKMFINKSVQPSVKVQPSIPKPPERKLNNNQKKEVLKGKIMERPSSKKSLRSNDSRKQMLSNSRSIKGTKNESELFANKHMALISKQFPEEDSELDSFSQDKISRMNQKIREMIRKFNEELNELINRNMIYLKEKTVEKVPDQEERLHILQEQIRSGAVAIENMDREFEKLQGREGELKQEEYQFLIEKEIQEIKEKEKDMLKVITKYKHQIDSGGNKLSRQETDKRQAQEVHQVKNNLIQMKREEEKHQSKLQKLDQMIEELQSKNSDKDYELSEQVDQAKEKGIPLNIKQQLVKKYQDLKSRRMALQNHRRTIQGLGRGKLDQIAHENQQIKGLNKTFENKIQSMYSAIQFSHLESIELIEKAKGNPKISSQFIENLNKILKGLQESQVSHRNQIRTEANKSQASERPLKTSMYNNEEKSLPIRNVSSKKSPSKPESNPNHDQINLIKPNFKKKEKNDHFFEEDQKSKRIWKQQQEKKQLQQRKEEEQRRQSEKLIEEEKKKPFTLKKNKNQIKNELKIQEKKVQIEPEVAIVEKAKQQEKPSNLGPRMMKFNKNRNKNEDSKNDISTENQPQSNLKLIVPEKPKQEEEQPIFAPKRLNLKAKLQKKQQSYLPTVEKSHEEKEKPKFEVKQEEEYKPKFNFKEEDPYKPSKNNVIDSPIQDKQSIKIPEEQIQAPKFSLKLRDRTKIQKKDDDEGYMPSRITEVSNQEPTYKLSTQPINLAEKKIINNTPAEGNLSKNAVPSTNPTGNPYAPKQNVISIKKKQQPIEAEKEVINNPYNPYAPKEQAISMKRQREGPIKKAKILNKGPQQKINIYEQAEDIFSNVKEIGEEPKPKKQIEYEILSKPGKNEELDLNAMLGIKKKEQKNDLDDLLGEIKVEKKKEKKKNNDFLNQLEF